MDIPKEVTATKAKESSSSSSVSAGPHVDVPVEVQVVSNRGDMGDIELMSTTSSDSDIGTAESCSPNELSKESLKTVLRHSNKNDNGNASGQTEVVAKADSNLALFNGFTDDDENETPLATISRSPSIQGNYSSSGASVSDLEASELFEHGDIVLAPNIDRVIRKQYSPLLNRISDDLNLLQQMPINENPWEFFENNAPSSSGVVRAATPAPHRILRPNATYSVGIQVNNPEIGNFMLRSTHCDWIRCMMCAVIVACIITGLCAATVMILNTFFQYWLLP